MNHQVNTKSQIIPATWKKEIDSIIERELLSANRYFAEANPSISRIVSKTSLLAPEEFYKELCERWEWHHSFYESLLEPAIPFLIVDNVFELTSRQIWALQEVYKVCSLVDQATLVISAAIKKHIAYWMACLPECQQLTEREINLILSTPNTPFPVQYHIDHLVYLASIKNDQVGSENIKQDLLLKYHANDEEIFEGRMSKFAHFDTADSNQLLKAAAELQYTYDHTVRHMYLTLERPRIKALARSLEYDNCEEKGIGQKLIGVSGFVLRKSILHYLQVTKILPGDTGIYDHHDEIVIGGLNKLLAYRNEVCNRHVIPFRQSGLTCTAACLTMIASHFNLVERREKFEMEVAEASKSKIAIGQHYSGVASKAVELGLEVVLAHSSPTLFDNTSHWIPANIFTSLVAEYNSYLSIVVNNPLLRVEKGATIDAQNLKQYIKDGYLVIVAGLIGNDTLHSQLLVGYNQNGFIVVDPLIGKSQQKSKHSVESFMQTPIGSWIMAVRPDQTAYNKLINALASFKADAKKHLCC